MKCLIKTWYITRNWISFLSILQSLGREGGREGQKGFGCTTVIDTISPTEAEHTGSGDLVCALVVYPCSVNPFHSLRDSAGAVAGEFRFHFFSFPPSPPMVSS